MDDYKHILRPIDKDFCDERYKALAERMELCIRTVNIRLEGMDKALDLKTSEMDTRLHGLNELRREVLADRVMFLTKETYNDKIAVYDKWVSDTSEKVTRMETRYEGRITTATILAVFSIIVALISMVVPWVMHR